jgi:NADH dehydrogenase [ubiquinone] 1 alpha subcomplex assembly factor 7
MERLDHFMARANAAFYAQGDALEHFTTAPEISQAFGECLGAWAAVTWEAMGRPDPVWLVELGPGRGRLMADALRAVRQVAAPFAAALRVGLVEASPALRAVQATRVPAQWFERLEDLPPGPAIVLANEFLDALPIRQFIRRDGAWHERHVADGALLDAPADIALPDAPEGAVQEINAAALAIAAQLAARRATTLFLDYGPAESGFGDTLQAVRHHARAEPLDAPGSADLTAHVDFAAIAAAARSAGAAAHGPLPQGLFLQRLGLMSRAAMLARAAPRQAGMILSGAERLVAPEGMGRLFKALCLCEPSLPTPIGFEP